MRPILAVNLSNVFITLKSETGKIAERLRFLSNNFITTSSNKKCNLKYYKFIVCTTFSLVSEIALRILENDHEIVKLAIR